MAEQTSLVRATSLCHGALSQRFQSSGRVHRVKPVPSHSRCASTASLLCSNGSGEESQNTDFLEGWQFSSRHLQTVYMWRTDCQRRDTLQNAAGTLQKTTNKNTKRGENTMAHPKPSARGRHTEDRPHPAPTPKLCAQLSSPERRPSCGTEMEAGKALDTADEEGVPDLNAQHRRGCFTKRLKKLIR